MPTVSGKKYPYTKKGKAAAKRAAKKLGLSKNTMKRNKKTSVKRRTATKRGY